MAGCLHHRGSKPHIFVPRMLALVTCEQSSNFNYMLWRVRAVFICGSCNASLATTSHDDVIIVGFVRERVRACVSVCCVAE